MFPLDRLIVLRESADGVAPDPGASAEKCPTIARA
jgi:hypothetical protein